MFKKFSKNTLRLFSMLLTLSMIFSTASFATPSAVTVVETAEEMPYVAVEEEKEVKANLNSEEYIPIYTIEDLYNIRDDLTANYILMNDIDLTEATASGGDWDFMGNGWNPIGSNDVYGNGEFSGEFDGNGHSIIGIQIKVTHLPAGVGEGVYLGLFANVSGCVKNLKMTGNIKYTQSATFNIGSISGYCSGKIVNCHSQVDIIGTGTSAIINGYVGGLVGMANAGAVIRLCSNSGEISSIRSSGINDSTTSTSNYASGIVGNAADTTEILQCYNSGKILSKTSYNYYEQIVSGSYGGSGYSKYHYGDGIACSFGIAGNGTVSDCYNSGVVEATEHKVSSHSKSYAYAIGGNVYRGYNSGSLSSEDGANKFTTSTCTNCYYLAGTCATFEGAISLSIAQMKTKSMWDGFDFENVWIINTFANHPYPQLVDNIQDMSESAELVSIIALPTKTEYYTGDKLNFAGSMVKVIYVSGREEVIEITDEMVSGFDMNVAGEQTVTVTVAGASDTYTVNVLERPEVKEISIIFQPDVTKFAVGTEFDFTGAQAMISYVGGAKEYVDITPEMTTGGNINHIGKQTITYSFGGKSATFIVEVVGIELDKIVLTSLPKKLNYLEGQPLDLTGMVVTAVMNNGIENTLGSGYTVSGYSSNPGDYTVTITYLGKTAAFDVTVSARKIVSLSLNALPNKLEYISGQEFDDSGMQVIATYDNGDVVVSEDYTVSGFDSVPGIRNVVITVDDKSVSFPVKVIARVITEFALVSLPSKLEYIEYESLDLTGLKVEATYNDGVTEEITDYEIAGFSSKPGIHTISVAYEGFVKSFDVTVTPRTLEDIKIKAPNKVVYTIGEEFDDTGLVVTACYNNGQEITLDKQDYQISGFDSAAPGTKSIKVSYNGIERSFAVVVYERTSIETGGHMTVGTAIGRLSEEVTIPVIVTKNTGIAGFKHDISFDADNLAFVAVEMVGGFTDGSLVVNDENADEGKLNLVWYDSKDVSGDGTVYNIVFEILETATDGDTDITISFEENGNGNVSGENVTFTPANGSVEIRSYWLGDLNGDRQFRVADLLHLAQYVAGIEKTLTDKQKLSADVNEDTVIDIHDVIMLQQWIVNAGIPASQTYAALTSEGLLDDVTKIHLGEIKGKIGQEVVVPVTIENNVGISAFMFEVAYNTEDLTFVSAELGGVLDKGVLITQVDEENQRLIVLWYSTEGDVSADGEMLPLTFKINDTASGTYDLSVRYLAEDILNEARVEILCSIESGKILVGSVLTGNLTSLLVDGNNDVTLVLSNGTEVVDELSISKGAYQFNSVAPGEYTLTVEKKNHATRTYTITVEDEDIALDVKLNLLGDIDGNGSVNMMDYLKAKQHSQGKNLLEDYAFDCADVSGDGKVNMMDYIKLKQHAQGTSSIWE